MRGFLSEDSVDPAMADPGPLVEVALHLHAETDAAWLVSETGRRGDASWLHRRMAERGAGRREMTWTLPEGLAAARGWL
ncbi:MAG: hypothetical protein ACOYM5_02835 [Caulobacter sp.]